MKVELSRYRVTPGKSERVDEWLAMLNNRMEEVLRTLDREQMKVEMIFREIIEGVDYLYWFSIQEEAGASVETSPFALDQAHIEFWNECIDEDYGRHDAQPQVIMVPDEVARAFSWDSPMKAAVTFERRELVFKRPHRST